MCYSVAAGHGCVQERCRTWSSPTVFVRSSNVLVVLNESAHYCGTVLKSTIINLGHPTKAAHFFISVSTWRPVFEGPWFQ